MCEVAEERVQAQLIMHFRIQIHERVLCCQEQHNWKYRSLLEREREREREREHAPFILISGEFQWHPVTGCFFVLPILLFMI